jgi:hypothetical protein
MPNMAVCAAVCVSVLTLLPTRTAARQRPRIDVPGAVTVTGGISALVST